jgi:Trk K+ transport system NAD-binding subunit
MPLTSTLERLQVRRRGFATLRWRLFREWCLVRALTRRLRSRILLLASILLLGGVCFYVVPEGGHGRLLDAIYTAFGLVFGDHPAELPKHWLLIAMHFVLPVVGLGVVLEGIVEIAAVFRDRQNNERAWSIVMTESLSDHVILVGMGRVGYRTYVTLKRLSIPVVVIDQDEKAEFLSDARRDGTPILCGDARREALLSEAGIDRARAVILATNQDLVNLEVALDARQKRPDIRVVMRMFDQNMADKVHAGFDIRAVLSTAALAAPTFATAALVGNVIATTVLDDQLLVTVRIRLDSHDRWCGRSIAAVTANRRLCVLGVRRNAGEMELFPTPEAVIGSGDELIVQGLYDELVTLAVASP